MPTRGHQVSLRTRALITLLSLLLLTFPSATSAAEIDTERGASPAAVKVAQEVIEQITRDGSAPFWVVFDSEADVSASARAETRGERTTALYEAKLRHAERTQGELRTLLTENAVDFKPFWITNAVYVSDGDRQLLDKIAQLPGVAEIATPETYKPVEPEPGAIQDQVDAVEWNVAAIRAHDVWSEYGVTGEGIVVANIDTGVDYTHPALVNSYRGNNGREFDHSYNWFDPAFSCGSPSLAPCDLNGHGTHTMGIMVGDDDRGNQIGVAPGATWIAANACPNGFCTDFDLMAAGEWILAPTDIFGQNPRPELAPHIVNNSWGAGPSNRFYEPIVDAWVAAGIVPIFASGNAGPTCNSAGSPGDYVQSYSVGAFDVRDNIANFSSRGPGIGGELKPNIAAPGLDVRSSLPGGDYGSLSGTSMAAPHIAGTAALLLSNAPRLIGDVSALRAALDTSAVDVNDTQCGGESGDNNVWGEGKVDALAAIEMVGGEFGGLAGTVSSGGAPLEGAEVTIENATVTLKRQTDELGTFELRRLAAGDYTVTARKFGYGPVRQDVTIVRGETVTVDLDLPESETFTITGVVRDGSTGTPLGGASVDLVGTPLSTTTTESQGRYTLSGVPAGEYQVRVDFGRWLEPMTQDLVVNGDETLDFNLEPKSDDYGFTANSIPPNYVAAEDVLPLKGDTASRKVTTPFPVTFYGTTYRDAEVHTDGHVSFTEAASAENSKLPFPAAPNAAVYPFWDDLVIDASASVRTQTLGAAPHRRYIVEWRDAAFADAPQTRVSFEVVFHENGRIDYHYQGIDPGNDLEAGGSATVGLENETGFIGLEYLHNDPYLSDDVAISFVVPGTGLVRGIVTDANDGDPVQDAVITVRGEDGTRSQQTRTDAEGVYQSQIAVGGVDVTVSAQGYELATAELVVGDEGAIVTRDVELRTPRIEVAHDPIEVVVPAGETRQRTVTLRNSGSAAGSWQLKEASGGSAAPVTVAATEGLRGLRPGGSSVESESSSSGAGEILRDWPIEGLVHPWGIADTGAETGGVWISDFNATGPRNAEYTPDGQLTQRRPWTAGGLGADMAYVPDRDLLCQLDVLGDYQDWIRCWNPDSGEIATSFSGQFGGTVSRGLAYRAADDTFFVGTMSFGLLFHITGLSHPEPGTVIEYCQVEDLPVMTGLAYNDDWNVLWVASNSSSDPIIGINPDTCSKVHTITDPDPVHQAGGLSLDKDGNIWSVQQPIEGIGAKAFLIDSGLPSFGDVPWLSTTATEGSLDEGVADELEISIDATNLGPGVHAATLYLLSNSAKRPLIGIPVKVIVPEYQASVNAGGHSSVKDSKGDSWRPDQPYSAGNYGYLGKSKERSTTKPISGTADPELTQTSREGAYEYRFDSLPAGVYNVELRFAELSRTGPGKRLFDVIVEDELVLPSLDVAGRVGHLTAFEPSFDVEVTDGTLNVRLIADKQSPIISAIRVTERPDKGAATDRSPGTLAHNQAGFD